MEKCERKGNDFDLGMLCLRTTPISSNLPSPTELLYQKKLRGNLPLKIGNGMENKEGSYDQLHQRQMKQQLHYEQGEKDLQPLLEGQPVFVQDQQSKKWEPAVVMEKDEESRLYTVQTPAGKVVRRNRRHLKPANGQRSCEHTEPQVTPASTSEVQAPSSSEPSTKSGRIIRKPARFREEVSNGNRVVSIVNSSHLKAFTGP